MEKIHIFADSASDIPRAVCQTLGIEIVPIQIQIDGKTLREYYDVTPEEYWAMLEAAKEIPTTAQITPTAVLEIYRAAHKNGCTHVIGMMINSKGSGCYQSACVARDLFYEEYGQCMQIELIDSQSYTYIYGHIVAEAAKMRMQGENFAAIVAVIHSRVARAEAVLGVYRLTHLKKSGRISGASAFVGEALGVRPISLVGHGAVTVIDKVRGDKNVIAGMIKQIQARVVDAPQQIAGLLYGDVAKEQIAQLEEQLLHVCKFAAVEQAPIGASVITNTGPLALAVYYYGLPQENANI